MRRRLLHVKQAPVSDEVSWLRLPDLQRLAKMIEDYYQSIDDLRIHDISLRDSENGREGQHANRIFYDREDELRALGNIQSIALYYHFNNNYRVLILDIDFMKLNTLNKIYSKMILEIDNDILLHEGSLTVDHFKFYNIPLNQGMLDTENSKTLIAPFVH